MQECHAGRDQDGDKAVLAGPAGVGQSQREEAGCSQHYQVDGDLGLYCTLAQIYSPCDAGKILTMGL